MCCCAEKLGIPCLNSRGFYFSLSMGLSSVAFHSEKSSAPRLPGRRPPARRLLPPHLARRWAQEVFRFGVSGNDSTLRNGLCWLFSILRLCSFSSSTGSRVLSPFT